MSSDSVTAALGMAALFIFTPMALLSIISGHLDVATFAMATAAFLVGLANHE